MTIFAARDGKDGGNNIWVFALGGGKEDLFIHR